MSHPEEDNLVCANCGKQMKEGFLLNMLHEFKDRAIRFVALPFCCESCGMQAFSIGESMITFFGYAAEDRILQRYRPKTPKDMRLSCFHCHQEVEFEDDKIIQFVSKWENDEALERVSFACYCSLICLCWSLEQNKDDRQLLARFFIPQEHIKETEATKTEALPDEDIDKLFETVFGKPKKIIQK